jgi:hypothetical protein
VCFQRYSQGVRDHLAAGNASARAADSRALADAAIAAGPAGPRPAPPPRRGLRLPSLAAAGLAVLLAAVLLLPHGRPERRRLHFPSRVRMAVEIDSWNSLVLPGVEQVPESGPGWRGVGTAQDSVLSAQVDSLWSGYQGNPEDAAPGIEAVAGQVAMGAIQVAHARLIELRNKHPHDPDGLLLQALIDYREGRAADAEERLQEVADRYRAYADRARLNLGILLMNDPNRRGEAERLLRDLEVNARDAYVRDRAKHGIQTSP